MHIASGNGLWFLQLRFTLYETFKINNKKTKEKKFTAAGGKQLLHFASGGCALQLARFLFKNSSKLICLI